MALVTVRKVRSYSDFEEMGGGGQGVGSGIPRVESDDNGKLSQQDHASQLSNGSAQLRQSGLGVSMYPR